MPAGKLWPVILIKELIVWIKNKVENYYREIISRGASTPVFTDVNIEQDLTVFKIKLLPKDYLIWLFEAASLSEIIISQASSCVSDAPYPELI